MYTVIANGAYTLNASAKTIAFTDTTIKKEAIIKIIDVDNNNLIYDSNAPVYGKNITLTGTPGIFSFEYGGVPAGAILQITVDYPLLIDGGTP